MSTDRIWGPKQRFLLFDVVACLTHVSATVLKSELIHDFHCSVTMKNFIELLLYWNIIFETNWVIPGPWSLMFSYTIHWGKSICFVVSLVGFVCLFYNSRAVLWKEVFLYFIKHNTVVPRECCLTLWNLRCIRQILTLLGSQHVSTKAQKD